MKLVDIKVEVQHLRWRCQHGEDSEWSVHGGASVGSGQARDRKRPERAQGGAEIVDPVINDPVLGTDEQGGHAFQCRQAAETHDRTPTRGSSMPKKLQREGEYWCPLLTSEATQT